MKSKDLVLVIHHLKFKNQAKKKKTIREATFTSFFWWWISGQSCSTKKNRLNILSDYIKGEYKDNFEENV